MPFQFTCPQGHLLEAEPAQAGQQCNCPTCGALLMIPQPPDAMGAVGAPPAVGFDPGFAAGPQIPDAPAQQEQFPGVGSGGPAASPFGQGVVTTPQLLHIPCPNKHELEVPPDMVGQDVMCPHCNVQFRLNERDSKEYKRRKKEEQELKDFKAGKTWLMWAVIFAVCILLGLVILIAASQFSS